MDDEPVVFLQTTKDERGRNGWIYKGHWKRLPDQWIKKSAQDNAIR